MTAVRGRVGRQAATLSKVRRLLAVCALLVATSSAYAQTQPKPDSPPDAAARALETGRFDQVDQLLKHTSEPRAALLRAQADLQRGRYAEAERLLAPLAAETPASDAALELGLLQLRLGRRNEATRTLEGVLTSVTPETAADYRRLGIASRALGQFQEANGYFREASALAPDDPLLNTAWGELFLEKYNRPDAMRSFQAALRVDADHVPARVGLARVALEENPPVARAQVERALATNPNYVPAHLLAAEMALDDAKRADAKVAIEKALQINPQSLEARALKAAVAFLEGRLPEFFAEAGEVLKINPLYGEVYRVAGEHAARNYRFDEAADLTRRALAIDRENTRGYADLGLHLLRTGDEAGARRALETAFRADPYDVVTYNLLSLLDTLDKFETFRDGDIVLRLHADEAPILKEYALPLAKEALDTLSKRWEFRPRGPILIEIFPRHDDFAVRTLGLPGMIGALGACFGRVVTMDSPKARPPGTFNWGATLWHEMAHVITLQMSNNRVPRWLTEGISVFEEKRHRSEWGREMEVAFAQALEAGKVPKLRDLNSGFSNPQLISLSYYQASLLVEHLAATHGEGALRTLLKAYGKGLDHDAAMKEAFGATFDSLQAGFDAAVDKQFGGLRAALRDTKVPDTATTPQQLQALAAANPGSFRLQMMLGDSLQKTGSAIDAIAAYERAAQLVPGATGDDNPNARIAEIAMEQGDHPRAIAALEAVLQVDHTDVEAARKLAALVAPTGDPTRASAALSRVVALDPFDAAAQTQLGRLALERKDTEAALRAFRVALAAGPADRAAAHYDLAEGLLLSGQAAEAKKQALYALEIAPSFEKAQELLLRIVDGRPNPGGRQ